MCIYIYIYKYITLRRDGDKTGSWEDDGRQRSTDDWTRLFGPTFFEPAAPFVCTEFACGLHYRHVLYIYIYIYIVIHVHVFIYIYTCIYTHFSDPHTRRSLPARTQIHVSVIRGRLTPSPPTKSFDFRGFDSSRLLILRGGNSHVH